MLRGLPWTIHLNGIASIISDRNSFLTKTGQPKAHVAYFGLMDLPTHTLGRKTENLRIWSKFCLGQNGFDDCQGLPCSLIDLLCCITEPGIEQRLLNWQSPYGTPEKLAMWDLNRHGGIIMAHESLSNSSNNSTPGTTERQRLLVASSVRYILDTVRNIRFQHTILISQIWSALFFPLVAAGSQAKLLSEADKDLIVKSITDLADGSLDDEPYFGKAVIVLQELWYHWEGRSIQQVARALDLELALF